MWPSQSMRPPLLPRLLVPRLPFFYGWVVLGCICLAGFARQGPAVAVLSVFVVPMTDAFGWSRMEIAGAVSLGGVLAAFVSPMLGRILDRRGARLILCLAVLGTGFSTMALSLTQSLLMFYLLFCFARLNWAGPFDLGIYGALNSWFVARRALAASIATLAQMSGLVALPIIAQLAMRDGGWRSGWMAIGATVLIVGFLPVWLFLVRRPEDVGLVPDSIAAGAHSAAPEPRFSRAEAMRTQAFWLLSLYTVLLFPVQAGVSLHQAPHLIERGDLADRRRHRDRLLLRDVGRVELRCGLPPAALAVALHPAGLGGADERRLLRSDRHCLGRGRLPRGWRVRPRPRRHHDLAAGGVGRLFRAGKLRRDSRRRAVVAGDGAGDRPVALRRLARLERQLY
jgi:hypothetical protein